MSRARMRPWSMMATRSQSSVSLLHVNSGEEGVNGLLPMISHKRERLWG